MNVYVHVHVYMCVSYMLVVASVIVSAHPSTVRDIGIYPNYEFVIFTCATDGAVKASSCCVYVCMHVCMY